MDDRKAVSAPETEAEHSPAGELLWHTFGPQSLGIFNTVLIAAAVFKCAAARSPIAFVLMSILLVASAQLPLGASSMTLAQRRDRAIVMLLTAPCMNLVFLFHLPGFEVVRTTWLPMVPYHALLCSAGFMMPPMHSLIHLTLSTTIFG